MQFLVYAGVLLIVFAIMVAAQSVPAGQAIVQKGVSGVKVIYDIPYATVGTETLKLDVYTREIPKVTPGKPTNAFPAVVYIHGGGWTGGDKSLCGNFCRALAEEGFVAISINYRLSTSSSNHFPAAIHDSKGAIRWIRAHAAEYKIDPTRIAVVGSSSGGNLASLVGTSYGISELEGTVGGNLEQRSNVQAVVDLFGVVDFPALSGSGPITTYMGCAYRDCPSAWALASPVTHVSGGDSPFLILHGVPDSTLDYTMSKAFHQQLLSNGVSSTLILDRLLGHSYIGMVTKYEKEIILFLRDALS
ncbi:MAG: alpha/beta hydrolase [Candidatus Diapherotrites archaeon]